MAEDGIRALVVEDSITQALRLTALLEEHGIHADRAATGEEALDHLSHNRADLILIDFHLPSMRGDELCRQIRMNPATAHIPILMLTDDVQDVVERQGLESGADDHIPKSIAADGLMARINALLRNRRRGLPFQVGAGLFQRHRVVAVDDSPTFLEHLRQELDHEGYEVTTFADGERAFAAVSQGGCDCALVDLVMPGMDGIELCRRLDELRTRSGVWFPLLMVTGRDTKDDMMRALEAGADDFVSKSSDAAIRRARIRAL
ncbi:MAG: response regulator, partial [Rhodospirillaceae bacterium]|nr:response regulator [Rhodospirillaceae bacterium]